MNWGILMAGVTMFGMVMLVLAQSGMDDRESSDSAVHDAPDGDKSDVKKAA